MLRNIKSLMGFRIQASGEHCGKVGDVFFDDHAWTIRYIVVATGNWLIGRRVLIPRAALGTPDWDKHVFPLNYTREDIENSPPIRADAPVSRQHELALHQYFQLDPYWSLPGAAAPVALTPAQARQAEESRPAGDPRLRSCDEVMGYHIEASDGPLGHVDDFSVDDETWALVHLIVDTRNWLPGRKVVVAVPWIETVSWPERRVYVDMTREEIRTSPEVEQAAPFTGGR